MFDPLPRWARDAVPGPPPAGLARVYLQVFAPEAHQFHAHFKRWRPVDVMPERELPPLPYAIEKRRILSLHLPADEDLEDRVSRIRAALLRRHRNPDRVAPERWHLLNAVALGPFRATPDVLLATDIAPNQAEKVQLRLATSAAYGLGTHPSTRLLLRALTGLTRPGPLLDVGAGSGVIGMAAVALGAPRAWCVESQWRAGRDLLHLALVNGLARRVELVCADAGALEAWPPATLLAANLPPLALARVLPRVLPLQSLRGCLLSGFQAGHEAEVRARIVAARPQARVTLSGLRRWRCLRAQW